MPVPSLVLGTNVVVSAVYSPESPPADILRAVADGLVTLYVSPPILAEYGDVVWRPKFDHLDNGRRRAALALVHRHFPMGEFRGTRIVAARAFLEITGLAGREA